VEITSPTMSYAADPATDTYTFTFSSADFGNTGVFDFYADSTTWSGGLDIAPNLKDGAFDFWTYEIAPASESASAPEAAPEADYALPRPIMELFDGSMYLFADGEFHYISAQQFATYGLSMDATYLVGELYGTVGAPATDEQVQVLEQQYIQDLNAMGVEATLPPVKQPAPVTTPVPAPAPVVVESPVINPPLTLPTTPKAGKVFTVSFPITSSVTGQKLTTGTMICDPQVKGKIIKHAEHFTNGKATLRFTIPATAKGKLLKVHLTMVLGNQSTTRVTTFLVH
jgi:hypothetical protein